MKVKWVSHSQFLCRSFIVKNVVNICLLLFSGEFAIAKVSYPKFISREAVISKARKYGFKFQKDDERPPTVKLDSVRKVWIVSKFETKHIRKGPCSINQPKSDSCDCSKTNGCAEVTTRELRMNAATGKLLRLKTFRKRFPNYE